MSKILNRDNIDIAVYHESCFDGFGSAFIVWYYYKKKFGIDRANKVNFISVSQHKTILSELVEEVTDKNIIMLGSFYKYDKLIQIINACNNFIIFDYNETAKNDLEKISADMKIFNEKKNSSLSGITWQYFLDDYEIPFFLGSIENITLWKKYTMIRTYSSNCMKFMTFFYEQKFDFELWETYLEKETVKAAITIGAKWLEYNNILINKFSRHSYCVIQEIDNKFTIICYANSPELKFNITQKLFQDYPMTDFFCVWHYNQKTNSTYYSLRSNGKTNVSQIADRIGCYCLENDCDFSEATCLGLSEMLPFAQVPDFGIILLLANGIKGNKLINKKQERYTLFRVDELKKEWTQNKYRDLIQMKCFDSLYIVFERNYVTIDDNDNVNMSKIYSIMYNIQAIQDPIKKLSFIATNCNEFFIEFISPDDFANINLATELSHPAP